VVGDDEVDDRAVKGYVRPAGIPDILKGDFRLPLGVPCAGEPAFGIPRDLPGEMDSPSGRLGDRLVQRIIPGAPDSRRVPVDPAGYQFSAPIATAVSLIRFEKPHSLSYQDSTRQSVPPITLVWSMWKTEEWLSWLKSIETSGSSV